MSTIQVTVISAQGNAPKTIQTSATTWGALEAELNAQDIATTNMKAMVRETKGNLEAKDAVLPPTNFTLFLTPGKIKSGK